MSLCGLLDEEAEDDRCPDQAPAAETEKMNMKLVKRILACVRRPKCIHPRLQSRKWLEEGTPMVESWCPDCGWHDKGHVYADPSTWIE